MYVLKGNNHALVLFLFGSRHWFLALFSLANQSCTKDYDFIWGKERVFLKKQKQTAFGIQAGQTPWTALYGQRRPQSEDRYLQKALKTKLGRVSS